MKLITLLTDFGLKDGYPGVMKGVIWSIAPQAQIADLTHSVSPQNVREGALILGRSVPYFPAGSIHVAVVDPGVGTSRRPIAARLGSHYFIAPDNGLLSIPLERAEMEQAAVEIVHLDRPRFWLPSPSHTFHGRDIFAPCAAHLANGVSLAELGAPIDDLLRLPFPPVERIPNGWRGQVISSDHFGNLATNLQAQHLEDFKDLRIRLKGYELHGGLGRAYGERPSGEVLALIDSAGCLEIAIVNGSAALQLQAGPGDPVEVIDAALL